MINSDIINILICPDCSSKIEYKDTDLCCVGCHRKFKFHENGKGFFIKGEIREIINNESELYVIRNNKELNIK